MPALPTIDVVTPLNVIQPNMSDEVSVHATCAFRRCRGLEFPVSPLLNENQKSFIVQFIENNGDWPFSDGMKQTHIQQGLALLHEPNNASLHSLAIRKYRDPMFLATLLTGSFYPVNKEDKGSDATVGSAWCFVNVLIAHALRLLGHQGEICLPHVPRGYGVSASEYLERHEAPSNKRMKLGFSMAEEDVHQIIMSYVDGTYEPIFDEYTKKEQDAIIILLRQISIGRAVVIDLSESLFNSIANLFELDGEGASNYLTLACKAVLNDLCEKHATLLSEKLATLTADTNSTEIIAQLTHVMKDIENSVEHDAVLNSLSITHRALLVDRIKQDALHPNLSSGMGQASQQGMFSVDNASPEASSEAQLRAAPLRS